MTNPISYGKQTITEEDIQAVVETLRSDYLTQGPKIGEFEKAFAEYIGSKYAVAVSNGTVALHLAALILGTNSKSNVITTPLTFAASANCIRYCGGTVYFADIDPTTLLIDIHQVERLIKSKPKNFFQGLVVVDFAGFPLELERFRTLADQQGLWIIQDAAHAPGAYYIDSKGKKQFSGNCHGADIATFSFHPVKHIACGEGGMITTNDEKLYNQLLLLRTHGITKDPHILIENHGGWYYEMHDLGYNYRLTDIQAALGLSQLKKIQQSLHKRKEIAARYDAAFACVPGIKNKARSVEGHAFHLYVIETDHRKELYDHLRTKNIFSQVHYLPVHLHPYYKAMGWKTGDMPNAENYYKRCLTLPLYPGLTAKEQEYIIGHVVDFFK